MRRPADYPRVRLRSRRPTTCAGPAHRTLKRVTDDHAEFGWNTMVAALMELTNKLVRLRGTEIAGGAAWDETIRLTLLMLAPMAPHISEELWARRLASRGEEWTSIHTQRWPDYDAGAGRRATRSSCPSRSTASCATWSRSRRARPRPRSSSSSWRATRSGPCSRGGRRPGGPGPEPARERGDTLARLTMRAARRPRLPATCGTGLRRFGIT